MTGRRGRPKTSETSMPVLKKTKSAIPSTNFSKPTSSAMNKSVNNPVNSPVNSPTKIRVDSPVHSPTDSK